MWDRKHSTSPQCNLSTDKITLHWGDSMFALVFALKTLNALRDIPIPKNLKTAQRGGTSTPVQSVFSVQSIPYSPRSTI